MSDAESVTIDDVEVLTETDRAVRVMIDDRSVWIPKSVIQDESEVWSLKNKGPGTLVIAAWFAEKEGLE